jgi:hypothetical protein
LSSNFKFVPNTIAFQNRSLGFEEHVIKLTLTSIFLLDDTYATMIGKHNIPPKIAAKTKQTENNK